MTTYIIYKESNIFKAKNQSTGNIDFAGKEISVILRSVNNAIIGNGTILIEEGIYNPGSAVTFTKSIDIIGEGNVIFNWNVQGQDLFLFSGTELSTTMLTGNIAIGANKMTVTSVGSAIVGDLVFIYDDTIWNPGDYPAWKTGELHEVSYISGNTITITDSTINAFSMSNFGSVKLIRPITVEINGIKVNGADKNVDYRGIQLYYNKNSIIRNGKFQNNGLREVNIRNSYNTTIENNVICNNIMAGYGYGIDINDASAYTTVTNNHFYNCRHCVASGGYGIVGQPRDIIVSTNTFANSNGISHVLDAHGIVESFYIYDNLIYCPSTQYAIVSGSKITRFVGNTIVGGNGCCTTRENVHNYIYDIDNNELINSPFVFINETNAKPYIVSIKNNIISGNIDRMVQIYNADSFIVAGNQYDGTDLTDGSDAIYVQTCNNGIIANNSINNSHSSGIFLYATNSTVVSNNLIMEYNCEGAGNGYGIRVYNSSHNTISENILKRITAENAYGIREDGTSDYNRIFDNDLSQVGNDTSVGNRLSVIGVNSKIWKNAGFTTETEVTSNVFTIDSIGIKSITISHDLAIVPDVQDCYLAVLKNTNVTDWAYDLLIVDSVGATNVIAKINVSKASTRSGATARLSLRVFCS